MQTVTFKNTEYTVVESHNVPELLKQDGLLKQMTIRGTKGAFYLLQIWSTKDGGELYRTISPKGRVSSELK